MTGVLTPDYWTDRALARETVADPGTPDGRLSIALAARYRDVAAALRGPAKPADLLSRAAVVAEQSRSETEPIRSLLLAAASALAEHLRGLLK